jgi:hypothetical protein
MLPAISWLQMQWASGTERTSGVIRVLSAKRLSAIARASVSNQYSVGRKTRRAEDAALLKASIPAGFEPALRLVRLQVFEYTLSVHEDQMS